MQGDVARQLLEVVGARDEVGLAVELDQHADLAVVVDVAHDQRPRGGSAGALLGLGDPLLAQDLGGLLHVAAGLLQRLLQSIMPAPVRARSSLTSFGEIVMLAIVSNSGSAQG